MRHQYVVYEYRQGDILAQILENITQYVQRRAINTAVRLPRYGSMSEELIAVRAVQHRPVLLQRPSRKGHREIPLHQRTLCQKPHPMHIGCTICASIPHFAHPTLRLLIVLLFLVHTSRVYSLAPHTHRCHPTLFMAIQSHHYAACPVGKSDGATKPRISVCNYTVANPLSNKYRPIGEKRPLYAIGCKIATRKIARIIQPESYEVAMRDSPTIPYL